MLAHLLYFNLYNDTVVHDTGSSSSRAGLNILRVLSFVLSDSHPFQPLLENDAHYSFKQN
jgi:hypothetical protein